MCNPEARGREGDGVARVVVVVALSSASTRNSASQLPGAERVFRELVFAWRRFGAFQVSNQSQGFGNGRGRRGCGMATMLR